MSASVERTILEAIANVSRSLRNITSLLGLLHLHTIPIREPGKLYFTSKMFFLDSTTQYAAGGTLLLAVGAFVLFQPTGLVRWLQKKNYQYEVTFALYMLTPTEKFIFSKRYP